MPRSSSTPFVRRSFPEEEMLGRTQAWLRRCPVESQPVALLSGGELAADARYHILARDPDFVVSGELSGFRARAGERILREIAPERLMTELRTLSEEHAPALPFGEQADMPFRGGFVGAFGYDLAWLFEYGLPRYLPKTSRLPELFLGWYAEPVVLDRERGEAWGSKTVIEELLAVPEQEEPGPVQFVERLGSFHREDYEAAVERVREHCIRGDLFQADLSRRISLHVEGDPRALFHRLCDASPARFSAYLQIDADRAVLSSSPEEYLQLHGRRVRSRPIKGTRPRGADPAEDARNREELLESEKDLAELTMIVDLVRNDIGRVAEAGSVLVTEFPRLMVLAQVHHLLASVEARLDRGQDIWDLIAASFPPGSIVGAPKPKAIEVLERVERSRRGLYTGAIGYLDPFGSAHLSVAIRTAEWDDGVLRFGVGGGITALSDSALEFEETVDKARGLGKALGLAELG
jgi:para-aminobenzoate synthetase component 1